MVNLELYRIFYEVAEAGNLTRASKNLNISQPAVTKHIKNLEEMLGGPLFIRTKKGVVLNDAGEEMFIYIKQALSLINEAEKKYKSIENLEKGTIKIGISTNLTKKFLLKYIKEFHELYPNIIVEISTDPTSELIKVLRKGMIDFIVAKIPEHREDELDYKVLGKMKDIFVVNGDYPELVNKRLEIDEIVDYPILLQKAPSNSRNTIDNYCKENYIELNSIMNIASSNLLIDFVKIGYGIGFITREYIEDELAQKQLFELNVTPQILPNRFGLIRLKNNYLSFSAQKFIETILKEEEEEVS